jgi:hypothetical protein
VAVLFCWFAIILLLLCAVLRFTRWRTSSGWLLVLFPAILCIGILVDLSHGVQKLGQGGYNTDLRTLPYFLGLLAVVVLAALRPKWGWLFWIIWLLNALFCAGVVYLTFFWKVFS